jgi:S1-C subfamily serine protease
MRSNAPVITAPGSVSFHTAAARHCLIARASGPSRHPIGLALLGIGTVLSVSIACARIQPTASDAPAGLSPRERVIDRIVDSSVKVAIERDSHRLMSASGVVIASRPADQAAEGVSYVLTAAHVLTGAEDAQVVVGFCGPQAARGKFVATVIARGKPDTLDLALLRVPGIAVTPIGLLASGRIRLGEQILVVGFPEGERLGISSGIVSQLPLSEIQNGIPADRPEQRIVIDAAAPRGVSGGGVFDAETGRLVGIVQGHQTYAVAVKDQAQSYLLKFPVPGATFVVPTTQIPLLVTSGDVANELAGVLPVMAHTTPDAPK